MVSLYLLVALVSPLMSSSVELHLVHCPHRALHILHSAETFVKTEVVADSILKISRNIIFMRKVVNIIIMNMLRINKECVFCFFGSCPPNA